MACRAVKVSRLLLLLLSTTTTTTTHLQRKIHRAYGQMSNVVLLPSRRLPLGPTSFVGTQKNPGDSSASVRLASFTASLMMTPTTRKPPPAAGRLAICRGQKAPVASLSLSLATLLAPHELA